MASPQGEITLSAKLADKIDPRVVLIPYGWGHQWGLANSASGQCVNYLLDDCATDPISGIPAYKSMLCDVRRSAES